MADFNDSRGLPKSEQDPAQQGTVYPEYAVATAWGRLEPLVEPAQVVARYLFGIPLQSRLVNPLTGVPDQLTAEIIKDYINLSVNELEVELGLDIFQVQRAERYPFDRAAFLQWGYLQLNHMPVWKIDAFTVQAANDVVVYELPLEWVDPGGFLHGQVTVIPLLTGPGAAALVQPVAGSGSGAVFLSILGQKVWWPRFWMVRYTTGFPDGIPTPLNEIIGRDVAIRVLGQLGATNAQVSSASLGIGGLSQSVSSPGPNIYQVRIQQLQEERRAGVKRFRKMYGTDLLVGEV